MELSVVVPVHNEADNLRPLLQEIDQALEGLYRYEVIYVDDGSSDATLAQLTALKSEFPRLRVLRHKQCCGQSAALRTGVSAALGTVVATLDGDGQNDPADLPALLETWRKLNGAGTGLLVVGFRKHRKDTGWRRLSSRIANGVRGYLLNDRTPDTGCGLKVFARDVFLALPYFDHMHRFLPALVQRAGGKVVSIEVNHRPRLRGRSKYGTWNRLWAGLVDLCGVLWLQRRAQIPEVEEISGPTSAEGGGRKALP